MNDPSRFEHVGTQYHDDGDTRFLIMRVRGKNVFGSKVLNSAQAVADTETGEILSLTFE